MRADSSQSGVSTVQVIERPVTRVLLPVDRSAGRCCDVGSAGATTVHHIHLLFHAVTLRVSSRQHVARATAASSTAPTVEMSLNVPAFRALLVVALVLCCSALSPPRFPPPPSTADGVDLSFSYEQRLADVRDRLADAQRRTATSGLVFAAPSTVSFTSPLPPVHASPSSLSAQASPLTISPLDFGGDPYGTNDSTAAFHSAIAAMLQLPLSHGAGSPRYLSDRIIDLGGVTLDLQGGDYLVSAPLVFPPGFGNYKITRGTVRASPSFAPSSGFLIHVGNSSDVDVFNGCGQCSWAQNVQVTGLLLDSADVSAGGVWISGVMGAVLRDLYVVRYGEAGQTAPHILFPVLSTTRVS